MKRHAPASRIERCSNMVKTTVKWPTLTVLLFLVNVYGHALLPRRPAAERRPRRLLPVEEFEEDLGRGGERSN